VLPFLAPWGERTGIPVLSRRASLIFLSERFFPTTKREPSRLVLLPRGGEKGDGDSRSSTFFYRKKSVSPAPPRLVLVRPPDGLRTPTLKNERGVCFSSVRPLPVAFLPCSVLCSSPSPPLCCVLACGSFYWRRCSLCVCVSALCVCFVCLLCVCVCSFLSPHLCSLLVAHLIARLIAHCSLGVVTLWPSSLLLLVLPSFFHSFIHFVSFRFVSSLCIHLVLCSRLSAISFV